MEFSKFFRSVTQSESNTQGFEPRPWQAELGNDSEAKNRLIRIPTGEGKTLGVLSAWVYHRVERQDQTWPTRLVWCLPMRTLVEQTVNEAEKLASKINSGSPFNIHTLMGGSDEKRWYADPETPAVLIGTQDMLLSRALNRGYAMGRAAWPRAFGLLNTDCLWVMDEIQIMGVGLSTSSQIQAFWENNQANDHAIKTGKPRATWWMSATLQSNWLETKETQPYIDEWRNNTSIVQPKDQNGAQWDAKKKATLLPLKRDNWPELIWDKHKEHAADPATGRQTLVVLNTVKSALEVFKAIKKLLAKDQTCENLDVKLIHSRFRPAERETWISAYLSRQSLKPDTNRILIATQVVEAGVDISASCLITELAPWPSLVQRFGRAARYGGEAEVIVLDQELQDEKKAAPYLLPDLNAAAEAVGSFEDVSISKLEAFEQSADEQLLARLYPFTPLHIILENEFEELFDSSQDLSGSEVDVSRFIREGDERNVQVFWRNLDGETPNSDIQPLRRELCPVPIIDAKKWLKKVEYGKKWTWDYVEGIWRKDQIDSLRPGQIILVEISSGGYDPALGFTGDKANPKLPIVEACLTGSNIEISDYLDASDSLSEQDVWKTIFTHCQEAGELSTQLCNTLQVPSRLASIVNLALRLHDWGKSHPAFSTGTYLVEPSRADLAKAPHAAWRSMKKLYETPTHGPRKGFRHELASCLSTLELLRSVSPNHPAILGEYQALLTACNFESNEEQRSNSDFEKNELAIELNNLKRDEFNLLLYLIVSHHGKVRCSLQASPQDQDFPSTSGKFIGSGQPLRGVRDGDVMPETILPSESGEPITIPEIELSLQPASLGLSNRYGASWSERVDNLLNNVGPFTLAWLEALVRCIDGRASDDSRPPGSIPDPLIKKALSIPAEPTASNPTKPSINDMAEDVGKSESTGELENESE